jgi:hypothetical protein
VQREIFASIRVPMIKDILGMWFLVNMHDSSDFLEFIITGLHVYQATVTTESFCVNISRQARLQHFPGILEFDLGALSSNATAQLDILGHDGHTLSMDGSQVSVLKESHQVGLGSFLEAQNTSRLESKVGFEVLGDLAGKALEGQLANEEIRRLLVAANFAQGHRAWAVAVRLLDASSQRHCVLASRLGDEINSGCLATSHLARYLFRAGHSSCKLLKQQLIITCSEKVLWEWLSITNTKTRECAGFVVFDELNCDEVGSHSAPLGSKRRTHCIHTQISGSKVCVFVGVCPKISGMCGCSLTLFDK